MAESESISVPSWKTVRTVATIVEPNFDASPIDMSDSFEILRCIDTGSRLKLADDATITQLNQAISRGELTNRLGQSLSNPINRALVNEPGTLLYAIVNDIPQMVLDEAIPLDQLSQ